MPEEGALRGLLDRLRGEQAVYVHCASGHGRSATVAAALLLSWGLAASVCDVEAQLRYRRPWIRLNGAQRRSLEGIRLAQELARGLDDHRAPTRHP